MKKVTVPARQPMNNILNPPMIALRLVYKLNNPPMIIKDSAEEPILQKIVVGFELSKKESNGINAPMAKEIKDAIAAPEGEPSSFGFNPSSSRASVSNAFSGSLII